MKRPCQPFDSERGGGTLSLTTGRDIAISRANHVSDIVAPVASKPSELTRSRPLSQAVHSNANKHV